MNDRAQRRTRVPGPLVVSSRNPRYFAVREGADERAVYLTGSHLWNNLHDGMGPGKPCADEPERMDFGEYLDFLEERGLALQQLGMEGPTGAKAAMSGSTAYETATPAPPSPSGGGTGD